MTAAAQFNFEDIGTILDGLPIDKPQGQLNSLDSDELKAAVRTAIMNPIDYPSISDAIYDGDCVVIAIQGITGNVNDVIETIVTMVNANRSEKVSVTVLADAFTASRLDLTNLADVSLVSHDPDNDQQMACLAVGANDQALYVNRLLFDADIVIPIGCLSPLDKLRTDDCLFPNFSSRTNREAFHEQSERDQSADVRRVNNLLGTFFAVQLILGPGDIIHEILAGERRSVLKATKKKLAKLWSVAVEKPADLFIATIETLASEPNWEDFGRALVVAERCSQNAAPIVVCTHLKQIPSREIRMALRESLPETLPESKRIANTLHGQMSAILASHPVYLASQLTQSDVERMGLGFLNEPGELKRIAAKCSHGMLLRDAHKCEVDVPSELP